MTGPECSICLGDLFDQSAKVNFKSTNLNKSVPNMKKLCDEQPSKSSSLICVTPCGHPFHRICISNWIQKLSECPNCRASEIYPSMLYPLYLPLEPNCSLGTPSKVDGKKGIPKTGHPQDKSSCWQFLIRAFSRK